jgi:hypothetical protein
MRSCCICTELGSKAAVAGVASHSANSFCSAESAAVKSAHSSAVWWGEVGVASASEAGSEAEESGASGSCCGGGGGGGGGEA